MLKRLAWFHNAVYYCKHAGAGKIALTGKWLCESQCSFPYGMLTMKMMPLYKPGRKNGTKNRTHIEKYQISKICTKERLVRDIAECLAKILEL
jgi:hypothetical protein